MKKKKTLKDIMAASNKKQQKEVVVACGCAPSLMDGTEHTLNIDEKAELPDEFSWVDNMPPIRNQGNTTTCVCQSLTCVLDYMYNSEHDTPGVCNNFSIDELYACRANKRAPGMSIKEALHYLRHTGLKGYKINEYAKIRSAQELKHALIMFGPCVAGLPCYNKDPQHFWNAGGQYFGGHAITFVGYTKEGFIIRNSWGTAWGKNGYNVMPYRDYETKCFEAWAILL